MSFGKKPTKLSFCALVLLFFFSLSSDILGQVSLRGLRLRSLANSGSGGSSQTHLPKGYVFRGQVIRGNKESGLFKNPQDIFVDGKRNLYVADTGNDRILKFDPRGRFLVGFGGDRDGREKFNRPSGLFVNEGGDIYVADTENHRVLKLSPEGEFLESYDRPDFIAEPYFYRPGKIVVDKRGYLYIINASHTGEDVFVFEDEGSFLGYFVKTGRRPTDIYTPANITLDEEGFIYMSQMGAQFGRQIKKFDYQGGYVMSFHGTGDRVFFDDLAIDGLGNLFAIDGNSRRIVKFDPRGRPIFILTGRGRRGGTLGSPAALSIGPDGKLYILDGENNIKVFHPTQFARLVDQANDALINEDYGRAVNLWKEVIKLNNFFDPARIGLGESYLKQGRLEEAMAEFAFVGDNYRLSGTLRKYRRDFLLSNRVEITLFALGISIFIPLIIVVRKGLNLPWRKSKVSPASAIGLALGVLSKPERNFERLRDKGGFLSGTVVFLLFCVSHYLSSILTNPLFLRNQPDFFLLWTESVLFIILWAVWSLASFGVGEVFNGIARFKAIAVSSAYCLTPYIIFSIPLALLSNLLVLEEKRYYDWVNYILYVWVGLLVFLQTKTLQGFSAAKTIYATALSLCGVAIFLGAVFLVYGINYQMVGFVRELITEVVNKTL